jgi:RNA polymerase sigma-70 factor (ECF subfamily)
MRCPTPQRPIMEHDERTEQFVQRLTDHQRGLFAYVVTLLGDVHESRNVLQETNLVLWRRSAEFAEGTDFEGWARKIAHYQVLAYLRDKKRDRHLFDAELLKQIARFPEPDEDDADEARRLALRQCLTELPENLRMMISLRYSPGGSVKELARRLEKSEGAIKMAMSRVRQFLLQCIERRLATGP